MSTCVNCGLPLVPNHHPNAGKMGYVNIVGCPTGCLPCAEERANGRQKVIANFRIWLEDEIQKSPDDQKRLTEVLTKLNIMEESRRLEYVRNARNTRDYTKEDTNGRTDQTKVN